MAWFSPYNTPLDWANTKLDNLEALKQRSQFIFGNTDLMKAYVKATINAEKSSEMFDETLSYLYRESDEDKCAAFAKLYMEEILKYDHVVANISKDEPINFSNPKAMNLHVIRICNIPTVIRDFFRYYNSYKNTEVFIKNIVAIVAAYVIDTNNDAPDYNYVIEVCDNLMTKYDCLIMVKNTDEYIKSSPLATWIVDKFSLISFDDYIYKIIGKLVASNEVYATIKFVSEFCDIDESITKELYYDVSLIKKHQNDDDFDPMVAANDIAFAFDRLDGDFDKDNAKKAASLMLSKLQCGNKTLESYIDDSIDNIIISDIENDDSSVKELILSLESYLTKLSDAYDIALEASDDDDDEPEEDNSNDTSYDDDDEVDTRLPGSAKLAKGSNKKPSKISQLYDKYKANSKAADSKVSAMVNKIGKKLLGIDDESIERRITGGIPSVLELLKTLLGGYFIFACWPIAGLILVIVRIAISKNVTAIERKRIVSTLQGELDMVEEKIRDAESDGNRSAKYKLMRTKHSLENAIEKISESEGHAMTLQGKIETQLALSRARRDVNVKREGRI